MAKNTAATAKRDMRPFIAFPSRWTEDENPPVAFKEYPKMPLVQHRDAKGDLTGKADCPLFDEFKQPIIFENARAEAEWLEDHPKEAAWIAEAKMAAAPAHDRFGATSDALKATQDRLDGTKAELDAKDGELQDALAELKAAKALLASRKESEGKIDKRTKEYKEAHKTAAE